MDSILALPIPVDVTHFVNTMIGTVKLRSEPADAVAHPVHVVVYLRRLRSRSKSSAILPALAYLLSFSMNIEPYQKAGC